MFEREASPLTAAEIVDAPDQAAAWLAADRPGPDAVAAISMLDPALLSHAGRVDLLVALERQQAWLAAKQQQVLAAMADHPQDAADPADRTGTSWVREDVACALRLSAVTAQSRLHTATDLTHRLPRTLRMLDHGAISYLHARALTDAVTTLDPKTATEVETRVLTKASEQTLANFKRSLARAVQTLDPARIAAQHDHAMTERRVCLTARDDGMAELWALLPAEGAAAVMTAVDALASATPPTTRAPPTSAAPTPSSTSASPHYTHCCPKHRACAQPSRSRSPCPPCSAVMTSRVNSPATDRSPPGSPAASQPTPPAPGGLITDPTGRLLDYGITTYRPPADLTRFVTARDQTCTFPGCNRSAHRCDLDHAIPASTGGATNADNLAALCRRHHRAKHEAGWRVTRHETASNWTSPTGHRYQSRPPAYPIDQTATGPPF